MEEINQVRREREKGGSERERVIVQVPTRQWQKENREERKQAAGAVGSATCLFVCVCLCTLSLKLESYFDKLNMQTPPRKTLSLTRNPGPSCYEAEILTN